jgi:Holliday junction resolvase RusA-like endonuclease
VVGAEAAVSIEFFVPGIPRSTQTGTVIRVNGRLMPLRRNTSWSSICGLVARQYAPLQPYSCALAVRLVFWMPAPKSKKRERPTTRPDLENLCKGLLDSWNGVLFDDDSQVVKLTLEKNYGPPGVGVSVETL